MMAQRFLAVLSLLSAASAAPAASCSNVQIFVGVGHGETYPGNQQSITKLICSGRSSCSTSNIDYPSTSTSINYCDAVATGIKNGISAITTYVSNCPSSKIVLTGWSQGAQVVSDIISGGGGVGQGPIANNCLQSNSAALDPTTAPGSSIVAVAVYGDPRQTGGQSWDVGTAASKNGSWPRSGTQLAAEKLWAAKFHSFCASGDPACANGSDYNAHGSYFGDYAKTPAAWVNSLLNK